jgi:DNA-directed RNA polymerase subunit RPC12/RpoP
MRFDSSRNYYDLLREGITAARNGNKNLAWSLLNNAAQMNPLDATPWLWLTETTDDLEEKKEYLEQALAADPRNYAARRGLARLAGDQVFSEEFSPDSLEPIKQTEDPVLARTKGAFLCPKCGAHMEFNLQANALACLYCGFIHDTEERSAADSEQLMDNVLPTESGHRWAVSQLQLVCGQCGAHSLWPPGQAAAECPYCGSRQLIESDETEGLVDPNAIAIMQFDEKAATEKVTDWLGKGWTAPDDLKESAKRALLRPAYYPFWTFDGTFEIHWSCEVNEGTSDNPGWFARNGIEFEMFDDELIPGLTSLKFKDLNQLGHFYLKDVVEFAPDYLAGWPALTYDRPLAKATLLAREQIVRKVRRELNFRVLPGQQKRGLDTGGVNWSDMTFKYVLLPVWVGRYRYKGHEYKIMVNGQTGVVAGDKPKDSLKTLGIIISVIATLIVLGLISVILATSMGWI